MLGISPEIARRDAEGWSITSVRKRWRLLAGLRNSKEQALNEFSFITRLTARSFFQLLIIVGVVLSLFTPFTPGRGRERLTGTQLSRLVA